MTPSLYRRACVSNEVANKVERQGKGNTTPRTALGKIKGYITMDDTKCGI